MGRLSAGERRCDRAVPRRSCAVAVGQYVAGTARGARSVASDPRLSGSDETPHVRKVLKGIAALHPVTEKRAKPLQLAQLERLVAWLDEQIGPATDVGDARTRAAYTRNKAPVLLGFWRGFRSDELSRLRIEHIAVEPGRG